MPSQASEYIEPEALTLEDGKILVKLARKAIETYLRERRVIEPPSDIPPKLMLRGMSFVTLERLAPYGKELRGCIGFLKPVYPLALSVINAAIAAATEDPRFPPVSLDEMRTIVIELSVLSIPRPVENPLKDVVVGKHGIVVSRGWYSGTLLPQVPVDYCWDVETFLGEGCLKAGMEPDCWLDRRTRIEVYTARIFYEREPGGEVLERDLEKEYKERCLS